jgi:alkylhydroperoxidase family enzyme
LDEVNGGGWGCIYSHQPLPSRYSILLSADGPPARSGRSAPVDQRLKMQRSAVTAISTAILHLMRRQMSDRPSRGRSGRAPRTVREAAIIHSSEPVTFGFFGSLPTGRSAPEAGRSERGLRRSALILRTVHSVDSDFCIGSVRGSSLCRGRSAARARTVRAWPVFPKSFSCPE